MQNSQSQDKIFRSFTKGIIISTLFFLAACTHWTEAGVDKWRLLEGDIESRQAILATAMVESAEPWHVPNGDPEQGRQAFQNYGCSSCHIVPGILEADAPVGPPLTDWYKRRFIAGNLANTPYNLIQWIQDPQAIEPDTAMPDLAVTEQDARHIAAFLYTLGRD